MTIDATPWATLSRLALAAHGLTVREEDVSLLVLQGESTQSIATALHLSPHTVQDHLKKIFGKVGVSSRRELITRLSLGLSSRRLRSTVPHAPERLWWKEVGRH